MNASPPPPLRAFGRPARLAAVLVAQAIPLAAASTWPIYESNGMLTVAEPIFYSLAANGCLLAAWAALSPAKLGWRISVLAGGLLAGESLYAWRMPYLEIDGLAFIACSPAIVFAAFQTSRRYGLYATSAALVGAGGPRRRQFSLASLMMLVGLFALLCGLEGAISNIRDAQTWRLVNVGLFACCYASLSMLETWFLLHERRLGKALGLTAASVLCIAAAVSFALRRGPFGNYRFMEFAATSALELSAIASLHWPALLLVRGQGVRLTLKPGPLPAPAGDAN